MAEISYKIIITGQVQGVGFRPFVFCLAEKYRLFGSVSNNEEGVIIYVSGEQSVIHNFYENLIKNPPKVSKIYSHSLEEIPFKNFTEFKIIPSKTSGKLNLQLTPDFAICDDCKEEIQHKSNRRFNYPFTTCVNCGPRWAITESFPFERFHTSMNSFEMCETCKNEYGNPKDRRFHSQTNSCPTCGIQIRLYNSEGGLLNIESANIFKEISKLIKEGNIIAIKNTGGFLLCCDASNSNVIETLRVRKNRPKKPFAILYPSLELLKEQLEINIEHEIFITSSERPIVIIPKGNYRGDLALDALAPNLNQLGIMLPYSGILQLVCNELAIPIVATSGNIHGSPIISSNEIATVELHDIADYFVFHNLEITNPQDDSIIKLSSKFKHEAIFRRSRGFAPNSVGNYSGKEKIMAMGSHLKSSIAFLPNDYLYISQYLGNLDNFDVYNRFTETAEKFISLFDQKPSVILADSHPTYQSTLFGKELAFKLNAEYHVIQHHKAHFAAVLGEHNLFENTNPILGVIWDGTGYGDDGNIWGGEFFEYQSKEIKRVTHFEYFDWLAGDKMAKEPRLSLFSLADKSNYDTISKRFSNEEWAIYHTIKQQNTLKTSSVGRIFDAVASLLGVCHINTYEGEAAILLENYVSNYQLKNCKLYADSLVNGLIPTKAIINNIYEDLKNGVPKEEIIINFFYTLVRFILIIADKNKTKCIALSGGVFQNTVLIDMLKEMAGNEYKLFFNRNLSPNDENISFGQIMYHLHVKNT